MRTVFLLALLLTVSALRAQNVTMPASGTTNVSRCGNNVYDPGGTGDYGSWENGTLVICPTTPGARVALTFSMLDLENNDDFLRIYDGNSTGEPLLATLTGNTNPGVVQATLANPSGCLTLRFTSDLTINQNHNGFAAAISCIAPCQTINSTFVSSNPAEIAGGITRACQGQSINFVGGATFSTSGTGATYLWNFGDGTTAAGTNVNHAYAAGGSYLVNLTVTDPLGCTNSNFLNKLVQVSTTPAINTTAIPSPLCTNQFSALNANVAMVTSTPNCTPPVSGTTFLPDGSGTDYSTSITTDCYPPGSTLTTVADFLSVCLNMEHSFMNDLSMRLRCPNGQMVRLHNRGGSGTYLGAPLDDPTVGPGTGANYCFNPSATTLLTGATTVSAGSPASASAVAGNYRPVDPFTGLVGCPLNGVWTIEITDHQSLDNGYIFDWQLNLAASLTGLPSFTPTIVSQGWNTQTFLYPVTSTMANVVATTQATHNFAYTVTDNFGCTYTVPQSVIVNCASLPAGLVYFDAKALTDKRVELRWVTESEHNTNRFEIDRSLDGQNWEFVTAAQAAGDSETELTYSSVDSDPETGVSYYRLRTIDNDGAVQISDIDVVTINPEEGTLVIYPNPATDLLIIEGDDKDLETLQLLNALGQDVTSRVLKSSESAFKLEMDLTGLAKGTYMVKTNTTSYLVVKK